MLLEIVPEELDAKLFLRLEVMVKGALRNFHRGEDFVQPNRVEALREHDLFGGGEDPRFGGSAPWRVELH